jgi:hypothetical protein
LGIISVGSNVTDQVLIRICIQQTLEKKWEYNETVHQLFVDFKKAYDSVRREVLNNILTEFGVPMKLVRLIKECFSETYSVVRIDEYFYNTFLIQNSVKRRCFTATSIQLRFRICH